MKTETTRAHTRWIRAAGALVCGATLAWSTSTAAIDEAHAREAIDARLAAVQSCFDTELTSAPTAHGGLLLTVTLGSDGRVRRVDVTTRGPHLSADLARCAATAVRAAEVEGGAVDETFTALFGFGGDAEPRRVRVRAVSIYSAAGRVG